jgi:hypothetical protein
MTMMTATAMMASLLKQAMVYCCGVVNDNVTISSAWARLQHQQR